MNLSSLVRESISDLKEKKSFKTIALFSGIGALMYSIKGLGVLSSAFIMVISIISYTYSMYSVYRMEMDNMEVRVSDIKLNANKTINIIIFTVLKSFITVLVPIILYALTNMFFMSSLLTSGGYVALLVSILVMISIFIFFSAFIESMYSLVPYKIFYEEKIGVINAMKFSTKNMHKYVWKILILFIVQAILFTPVYGHAMIKGAGDVQLMLDVIKDNSGFSLYYSSVYAIIISVFIYPVIYTCQAKIFKKVIEESTTEE